MKNRVCVVGMLTKVSLAAVALMTLSPLAQAQVDFQFNYVDGAGVGFNHATLGATRKATLESSADILEAYFSNYTATIDIDVDGAATAGLAAAGANYTAAWPGAGFGDQGDVMRQILGGEAADPTPGSADGSMTWNFTSVNWEYGTDFTSGEYDFVSTAIHELMHTVGFLSGIDSDGSDLWGTDVNLPGTWEPFDEFVADSAGALIDGTTYVNDKTRWDIASVGGTGATGLFFIGANAVAANGGSAVNLYSPGTWVGGSSGSHLDDDAYSGTYNMESATFDLLGVRTLSGVEMGILKDIGYTNLVNAVPEPTSILVFGSVAICVMLRRRRMG